MTMSAYAVLIAATSITAQAATPVLKLASAPQTQMAQMIIRQRIVIRMVQTPPPRPVQWREKRGPKCVPITMLAAAVLPSRDSVDLMLRNGDRVRAKLDEDCQSIDFYSGFYVEPTADGQMCADRDVIHSRSGGQCGIERFRALVPER